MKKHLPLAIRVVLLTGFLTFIFTIFIPLINENADLKSSKSSCERDNSGLQSDLKICRDKMTASLPLKESSQVLASTTSFEDFIRDWDYSDFYIPENSQLLCPRESGARNYQRMYYKRTITPKHSIFSLKFKMHDQSGKNYNQQFVIGLADGTQILTELDIPTRTADGQTMSLRESSSSGTLIPRSPGHALSSPIEEGTNINLTHEIKSDLPRYITQTTLIHFISKYGSDDGKFPTYDKEVDDSNPDNLPLKLFVGSYVGGCIEVLDWSLN